MGANRDVAVHIIRSVSNRINNTVIPRVAVLALGYDHVTGIRATGLLKGARLLTLNSISGFIALKKTINFK